MLQELNARNRDVRVVNMCLQVAKKTPPKSFSRHAPLVNVDKEYFAKETAKIAAQLKVDQQDFTQQASDTSCQGLCQHYYVRSFLLTCCSCR